MQPRPIMVGLVLALSILVPASVGATEEFGTPQAGRRVYDLAAVLTPAEVDELEVRAEAIERAGAPVIVYLRLHDSSYEETVADARALMDAWDIRSGPGARDGVVLFFNLRPTDPKHGHFAIVAGEAHVRSGALDPAQLDRIARDMLPVLREGQLARGIAIGLEAVHYNLTAGAPSTVPHPVRQLARRVSGWPLNGVGGLASLAILAAVARYWSRTVTVARPASLAPTTMIPGDLAPALAGALVRGRLSEDLLTATLLDLAARGALRIEPAPTTAPRPRGRSGQPAIQIRLLDPSRVRSPLDHVLWDALTMLAVERVIPPDRVPETRESWPQLRQILDAELVGRGWFDPHRRLLRRRLWSLAILAFALTGLAVVLVALAEDPLGLFGAIALLTSGMVATAAAAGTRETTSLGEQEAAAWLAFRRGLERAERDPNLELDFDRLLPYAVAVGASGALDRLLQQASARGYAPAWFARQRPETVSDTVDFYPYWITVQRTFAPTGSGDGGGSASSGSAASGGDF